MNENYNKLDFFEKTEKVPREVYYHYTSINALYEIVKNKTFWLTSLISSNDKEELYYKSDQFIEDFKKIINDETDENMKYVFEWIKQSYDDNKEEFIKCVKRKQEPYALSLSNKYDNLTHWDRYAENSSGVAIGFNTAALKVYYSRMNFNIFGGGLFDVGKVIYSDNLLQAERSAIIAMSQTIIETEKKFNREAADINNDIVKNGFFILAVSYLRLKVYTKSNFFIDENEVRLFYDAASIESTKSLINLMQGSINNELYNNIKKNFETIISDLEIDKSYFSVFQAGIREYRKLCLKKIWGSGVIPEIILGPMCVQNRHELRKFLIKNGLQGTNIKISKVPIR